MQFSVESSFFLAKTHREIKGRFRKRVVLANVPSFRFSFRGNIRQNHPFKTTLLETTLLGSSEKPHSAAGRSGDLRIMNGSFQMRSDGNAHHTAPGELPLRIRTHMAKSWFLEAAHMQAEG